MAELSILMPVHNERATVVEAIRPTLETDYPVDSVSWWWWTTARALAGWWAKNRPGDGGISAGSLRAYEALLRLRRPIEDRIELRFGLSLIARASRPARQFRCGSCS